MAISVEIFLVPRADELKTGLWCPHCFKPSGIELPFDRISESGVSRHCVVLRKCDDCNTPLAPEAAP